MDTPTTVDDLVAGVLNARSEAELARATVLAEDWIERHPEDLMRVGDAMTQVFKLQQALELPGEPS